MTSESVELRVLRLCLLDPLTTNPFPIIKPKLVWLLKLGREANEVSTYHCSCLDPLALRVSQLWIIYLRYFISLVILVLSSSSGSQTRVMKNVMAGVTSGLAHLQRNNPCAVLLWKCSCSSGGNFGHWSLTLNKLSFHRPATLGPFSRSSGYSSIIFLM